jgi:YD repeat-containing protein
MKASPCLDEGLASCLFAAGPAASIPESDRIYDFLLGSWDFEVVDWLPDSTRRVGTGECHAAWVLEGRAIQDVWISPGVAERSPTDPRAGNRYGTTLRVYEPQGRVWRITWFNPVSGLENRLTGMRRGDRVEQVGRDASGNLMRWTFSDITATSVEWTGEMSADDGATWLVQCSVSLRRRI